MPLVAHIYPKGALIKDQHDAEVLAYAVRAGAELGVDIIKTMWSGSARASARWWMPARPSWLWLVARWARLWRTICALPARHSMLVCAVLPMAASCGLLPHTSAVIKILVRFDAR